MSAAKATSFSSGNLKVQCLVLEDFEEETVTLSGFSSLLVFEETGVVTLLMKRNVEGAGFSWIVFNLLYTLY